MFETKGIHHISAIVSLPQRNVDFYHGILGLRLVKKTVNFDDPHTYHLYFGDYQGNPGTLITFFPWPFGKKGIRGGGQVVATQYAIPINSMSYWKRRLKSYDIVYKIENRFNSEYLIFEDCDGLVIEFVEEDSNNFSEFYKDDISKEVAIKGFKGAVLSSRNPDKTKDILVELLGYKIINENKERYRLQSVNNEIGNQLDLLKKQEPLGTMGVGTVHHIAFRIDDEPMQKVFRDQLIDNHFKVTPIINRNYFKSIYFRERGNILFELATDGPGFTVDELLETLGTNLKLPAQHEYLRNELKKYLLPISLRGDDFEHKD